MPFLGLLSLIWCWSLILISHYCLMPESISKSFSGVVLPNHRSPILYVCGMFFILKCNTLHLSLLKDIFLSHLRKNLPLRHVQYDLSFFKGLGLIRPSSFVPSANWVSNLSTPLPCSLINCCRVLTPRLIPEELVTALQVDVKPLMLTL